MEKNAASMNKPNQKLKENKTGELKPIPKIETDEMKLKLLAELGNPDSIDALFPPELNAHLVEQLKVMTCENNELRKCIFTKDQEIKELNKTITELNQRIRDIITGTGPAISSKSAGIISAKITELCKQNRHLVAEIESCKTKKAALERKVMQLEIINKEHEKLDACLCKEEQIDANTDELKELNNKLAAVNKKLYESKNKNLELKNDILIATKILQQELGDKFTSIKELQNDLAGWKGRAQQIVLLQKRISDLEEKLNMNKKELTEAKKKDHSQVIRDIESKRKKEAEQAMKDLQTLKNENEELKRKLDAAKCRVRNLECDITTIRHKMQTFAEKSSHDDLLINEQRNQIKNVELHYQEILKENTMKINKMRNEIEEHKQQVYNTDLKIDALSKQANEKSYKIEELRAQLLRYEECSLQNVFFTPMKTATDNEIKKLSELVVTLNSRIDIERNKYDNLEITHRKLREKKRKLERKVQTLEEELKIYKDSKRTSRMSKSSLLKDIPAETCSSKISKKQSMISVETGKEKFLEGVSSESQPLEEYENLDKEELKCKLELADERLKIMDDKLRMIEEEKQEDFDHLTEMIQYSKQLFNEALTVLQREKCVCS